MQEHFQKTESVPKDFVTVEGVTSVRCHHENAPSVSDQRICPTFRPEWCTLRSVPHQAV